MEPRPIFPHNYTHTSSRQDQTADPQPREKRYKEGSGHSIEGKYKLFFSSLPPPQSHLQTRREVKGLGGMVWFKMNGELLMNESIGQVKGIHGVKKYRYLSGGPNLVFPGTLRGQWHSEVETDPGHAADKRNTRLHTHVPCAIIIS